MSHAEDRQLLVNIPFASLNVPASEIVSSIKNPDGETVTLSHYGDAEWDLTPYLKVANRSRGSNVLAWLTRGLPVPLVESAKAATLAYWRHGVPGKKKPEAATVLGFGRQLLVLSDWLHANGLNCFRDITPDVATDFIAEIRRPDRKLKKSTQEQVLTVIETLFKLNRHIDDAVMEDPWPFESSSTLSGRASGSARESSTEIIPQEIASSLFKKAEILLNEADKLLCARDFLIEIARELQDKSVSEIAKAQKTWLRSSELDASMPLYEVLALTQLSTACHVVLALVSGMRNHELCSLNEGAYYEKSDDGETSGWLKGESHKTFEGKTEWMVPSVARIAVDVQTRISAPLRTELKLEKAALAIEIRSMEKGQPKYLAKVSRHAEIIKSLDRIFLSKRKDGTVINLTGGAWRSRLKIFAKEFNWPLHPHQFRRTFAVFVAHNAMGDLRYLRQHFKHWSVDMTLLYARNAKQDEQLYVEMLSEVQNRKTSVVEHWLDESSPLSGGRVARIVDYRKRDDVKTLRDRRALAETISDQISIRSTGHSWCLSDGQSGCGGKGLYEMTRCSGCSEGVIDSSHAKVWGALLEQQRELLAMEDIGPGGRQRAERDLARAEKVVSELGFEEANKKSGDVP